MFRSGRLNCDATAAKLGIIDLVAQHHEGVNQQMPCGGDSGFGLVAPVLHAGVKSF